MAPVTEAASSFVNASQEELRCSICPSEPRFSNASHLLTHLSSKLHLKHCFELELQAKLDFISAQKLLDYQHWYQTCGIHLALAQRQKIKEQRIKDREIEKEEELERAAQTPIFVKKEYFDEDSGLQPSRSLRSTQRQIAQRSSISFLSPAIGAHSESHGLRSFFDDDFEYQTVIQEDHPEFQEEVKGLGLTFSDSKAGVFTTFKSRPVPVVPLNECWGVQENFLALSASRIIGDKEIADPKEVKLKGKVWPGMRVFDWATPELKAKRLANGGVKKTPQPRPATVRTSRRVNKPSPSQAPATPSPNKGTNSPSFDRINKSSPAESTESTPPYTEHSGFSNQTQQHGSPIEGIQEPALVKRSPSEIEAMHADNERATRPLREDGFLPAASYYDDQSHQQHVQLAPIEYNSSYFGYGMGQPLYQGYAYGQSYYGGSTFDSLRSYHNNNIALAQGYNYGPGESSQRSIVPFTYGYYGEKTADATVDNSRAISGVQGRVDAYELDEGWARRNLSTASLGSNSSTCSTLTDRSVSDSSDSPLLHGGIGSIDTSECGEEPDVIKTENRGDALGNRGAAASHGGELDDDDDTELEEAEDYSSDDEDID